MSTVTKYYNDRSKILSLNIIALTILYFFVG